MYSTLLLFSFSQFEKNPTSTFQIVIKCKLLESQTLGITTIISLLFIFRSLSLTQTHYFSLCLALSLSLIFLIYFSKLKQFFRTLFQKRWWRLSKISEKKYCGPYVYNFVYTNQNVDIMVINRMLFIWIILGFMITTPNGHFLS